MKRPLAILCLAALLLAACEPKVDPDDPDGKEQTDPEPPGPVDPPEPSDPPEPEPPAPGPERLSLRFSSEWVDLYPSETMHLSCEVGGEDFDPDKYYDIEYYSSNKKVAYVTSSGFLTGAARGSATITATIKGTDVYAERLVRVVDLSRIKKAYSRDMQFSCGYTMYYKSVTQSWDFFDDYLYACQVSGGPHAISVTRKPVHAQDPQQYMHLKYFGHGDNMFVERCDDGDYLWISNYGTLESGQTNRYTDSQILSRVRFQDGVTMLPSQSTDNYWMPGKKRIIAAYDEDTGTIAIWCRYSESWVYVYDLETIKAAPIETKTLNYYISYGNPAVTERPTVRARDLSLITPIHSFKMPFYNVPQGYDWHHGKLWVMQGDGAEADEVASGKAKNWATAYLINSQGTILESASVPWVANLDLLASEGLTDLGYFEPEGIKIKDGILYLGFASKDAGSSPPRRLNIFQYPLD